MPRDRLLPVGITLLLEYTAVLIVALVAFFFFKERVKARLWIAIALVLIGLARRRAGLGSTARSARRGVRPGRRGHAGALLPRRRAPGRAHLAARCRLLDDGVRDGVLGVLQRMVGARPDDLPAPVELGGASAACIVPLRHAARLRRLRFVRAVPALVLGPQAAERDGGRHRRVVGGRSSRSWWRGCGSARGSTCCRSPGAAVVLVGIVLAQTARARKTVVDADLAIRTGSVPTL